LIFWFEQETISGKEQMLYKLFPINEILGFWIYRTQTQGSALLWRKFKAAGYEITPEQFWVLARLREQQGMNQRELGDEVLKDRHNMTRILNLLEKKRHIVRRADKTDKRIYRIFLTESGLDLQKKLTSIVLAHLNQIFGGISPEDFQTTRRTLEHIVKNIEEGAA
jgi:DNA-binding MarR family transcriptional regulator